MTLLIIRELVLNVRSLHNQWFLSLSPTQQTAVRGSVCNIINIKHEELMPVTCPWRTVEVLQSILIGWDTEMRGMSALLIFKRIKCHRSYGFHGDTDLSSIRRIKLSVPAHVSPVPIISPRAVCSVHAVAYFEFLFAFFSYLEPLLAHALSFTAC